MTKKNVVNRVDRNLARRLREARREAGLSTRAVVAQLPRRFAVSHTTIASYENGSTIPPIDVLGALADFYKRTLNWFLDSRDTISSFRYWNLRARTPLTERRQFEAQAGKWADAYMKLDHHLGLRSPKDSRKVDTADDMPPELLAHTVRTEWLNLDETQPIHSMIVVLETFSAWALEIPSSPRIGGAAARIGNEHVVVVSPDISGDQLRMNAAHELARLLYDDSEKAGMDKATYRFACSLLLPESQLREAFEGRSFLKLVRVKEKFGVSLAAMIHMAESDRIINSTTARWLWAEMTRRNWKAHEPGHVWRDRAITFETMLECAIQDKQVSWSDAERITGIYERELRDRIESVLERIAPKIENYHPRLSGGNAGLKLASLAIDGDV
jgi:transcriptional regulator with XRE-family HTH domain